MNKAKRINIYMSEKLYKQLRKQAFQEHSSISRIIREALKVAEELRVKNHDKK